MALNELLVGFPSAQSRGSTFTRHCGSLLEGIPFKTIIQQQSPPPCFCFYISTVVSSHTFCFPPPQPHSGCYTSLFPLMFLPLLLRPHHLLFRHFTQYSDSPGVESDGGSDGLPGEQIHSLTCLKQIRMTGSGEVRTAG